MVYMYHSFLIHSSADGLLGCFHVLAIINSAAMNIGVHLSLSDLVSSVCMPRSGIAGSYGSSISSSISQSCSTLCDPTDCSTPGFPVLHRYLESAQTHVLWIDDTIQPSHPLLFPSPPVFNFFQHQGLFQWYYYHIVWCCYIIITL